MKIKQKKRLDGIFKLGDGWFDGEGFSPPKSIYDISEKIINLLTEQNLEVFLYPLYEGGIIIELDKFDIHFTIEINENSVDYYIINIKTDNIIEQSIKLLCKEKDILAFIKEGSEIFNLWLKSSL